MMMPGGALVRLARALVLVAAAVVLASGPVLGDEDLPSWEPDANVPRAEVPDVYKWNLDQLFPSDEAWQEAETELAGAIVGFDAYRGKLAEPAALEGCLDLYFRLHDEINQVTLYANLLQSVALTDGTANAMVQTSLALMNEFMGRTGFIRSELLGIPDDAMEKAYAARPGLAAYRSYLDNLRRRRARVLSPEAERVLALAGDNLWAEIDLNEIPSPMEHAFDALLSDIRWPTVHDDAGGEVQLTLSNFGRFRASKNRAVREEAVTEFFATLRQFQHVLTVTLVGQFELDVTYARARDYETAAEAYLDKDDLATAVLDNLIGAVNANLRPLHRYVELRRRALGVDEVHLYDLYVPLVPSVETEVRFPEAREIILEALKPMGTAYGAVLAEGLDPESGWIDLYPSKSKRSGAFSASVYDRHPYVFMNYQDSLDDMSTLAHEFGHALHSYLSMKKQPYSTYRYPPFLAEVASTANEALLSDYIVAREDDPARKAALLVERLEGIRTTIYRQTLFAEFENTVHGWVEDGKPITADDLDGLYADLVRRYYGPKFAMGADDGMEWAYIPHFYYKFYVFNYATGLSAGIAIAERIRSGEPNAVEDYLGMLEGGCSRPPLELLKSAGVDLTKPDAIEAALERFDDTITELEQLLDL